MMKTLPVNRNIIVSIFVVMLLIYGVQGISYGQGEAPIVTPGENNTSLAVKFQITLDEGVDENAYQIQLRRKTTQGVWISKCVVIQRGSRHHIAGDPDVFGRAVYIYSRVIFVSGHYSDDTFNIKGIFTNLEPGTTYEARYRDTNLSVCGMNPPAPDLWSEIVEGKTHLVTPPRVKFVDTNLAREVRRELSLDTEGGHIDLLQIPEVELAKLTELDISDKEIIDLTGLEHATQLTELDLSYNRISNVRPLAKLTQLTYLYLYRNQIRDVTPLIGLTSLKRLWIRNNPITDTSPLNALIDENPEIHIDIDVKNPEGYFHIALSDGGTVYGIPPKYTSDSHPGTVAYMLLAKLKGCDFAATEVARRSKVYIKTQVLGELNNFVSETVCDVTSSEWSSSWDGVRITHLRFFDESSPSNINEAIYNASTGQYELTSDTTEPAGLNGDVNGDGIVNIQDLVLVAASLGQSGQNAADVNSDGLVNIQDLVLVAGALGTSAAAPSLHPQSLEVLTVADVKLWLSQSQQLNLTDTTSQRGILFLEQLLTALTPKETALLPNYPNPFNPETWIPYHLAEDVDVTLHIYAMNGTLMRTLSLGHQTTGMYQSRSLAAYWDGRNALGESVASGVYFYTLIAGDFTQTLKMLILK